MQRITRSALVATALVATVLAVGAAVAWASNVHFKGSPTFRDNGLTLTSSGTLVGLGNGDVTANLTATGNPTAVCTNPSGKQQPPGQNPAEVTTSGSQSIPSSQVKNGTTPFSVTTAPPQSPVPGAPGCPSSNWTETITDVAFTSAHLTFDQGGSTVLTADCTFSSPTTNGRVPAGNVSCTTS
jgi:hypothetical protein